MDDFHCKYIVAVSLAADFSEGFRHIYNLGYKLRGQQIDKSQHIMSISNSALIFDYMRNFCRDSCRSN